MRCYLQVEINSDLELCRLDLLTVVMKYFSQRQRLQRCDHGVYGSARLSIFHVTLWGVVQKTCPITRVSCFDSIIPQTINSKYIPNSTVLYIMVFTPDDSYDETGCRVEISNFIK